MARRLLFPGHSAGCRIPTVFDNAGLGVGIDANLGAQAGQDRIDHVRINAGSELEALLGTGARFGIKKQFNGPAAVAAASDTNHGARVP